MLVAGVECCVASQITMGGFLQVNCRACQSSCILGTEGKEQLQRGRTRGLTDRVHFSATEIP